MRRFNFGVIAALLAFSVGCATGAGQKKYGSPTWGPSGGSGSGLTAIADQTALCNVSGGTAIPIGCTAAQMRTYQGIQDSAHVSLSGGVIAGPTISFAPSQLSDGPVFVTGSTGVLGNPTFTGLTATATTLTNDLITGKAGGQVIIGGTGAGESITIISTSNATRGLINLGTSAGTGWVYSNAQNYFSMGGNIASSTYAAQLNKTQNAGSLFVLANGNTSGASYTQFELADNTGLAGALGGMALFGSGWTTSGLNTHGSLWIDVQGTGSANIIYSVLNATGDHVWATGTGNTEAMRLTNAGNFTLGTGLATTAINGFLGVPSGAGPPTGIPASPTLNNNVPAYVDRINKKLYLYIGGWVGGTTPGAFN